MVHKFYKLSRFLCVCGVAAFLAPSAASAAEVEVETSTALYAKVDFNNIAVRKEADLKSVTVFKADQGQTYEVLSQDEDGFIKIKVDSEEGYISSNRVTVIEKAIETVDEDMRYRQELVEYALQFVGNPYQYGGSDPNTGADCSGFVRYVMLHGAGVQLNRSSGSQAVQGEEISYDEIRPGDLLFYGGSGYINHVAMYIGNGQIVHASTERTGIKTSPATYRSPVKIIRVIQ